MNWLITDNTAPAAALGKIPEVSYADFYNDLAAKLADVRYHVAHYFALPSGDRLRFFCLLLDDNTGQVLLASHAMGYHDETALPSLTALHPALHPFERDIAERYGVRFDSMPWPKPLRFPFDRFDRSSSMDNYPFYTMKGGSLHEVNVGPIHAGIIEPGAFRFICNGEQVLHLEIALGYQHRGVEHLFEHTDNLLRRMCLAETVAGDSAVAHATAFAEAVEKLTARERSAELERERTVALELERMAMQIADTGALSMDVGYQLGQVACEALRTLTINTTQAWCGNRFGKGLVRPHGTYMGERENRVAIITGPNMAGKSTYMRQVALITLMAQIGSFVPARAARIGVVDRIFTRIGASDDLSAGQSTFMVEMTEVADILKHATGRSLLILDEIGRGTSTFDGMSIAQAVLEHCSRRLGAKTLFATHYHELTELEDTLSGVKNYSIAIKSRGDDLVFLRKIVPGGADRSYGIEVAKLAGLPETVVKKARTILKDLEHQSGRTPPLLAAPKSEQVSLEALGEAEVIDRLRRTQPDTLTPIEAMGLLYELKQKLS